MMTTYKTRLNMLQSWALHDASLYRSFSKMMTSFGYAPATARVLDIGCGANAPMSVMLHSAGVQVTGVDGYIGHRWGLGFRLSRYCLYQKEVGILKTLRKMAGELIYDRHYYAMLSETLGFPLTEDNIDLRQMSAEDLQFEDCTFDVIYSNATWEHLVDVRAANEEVARVLRPGGLACIEIHLFPSLSGGHDLPWIVPGKIDLGDVIPWGHLLDPVWKAPVYLNRLRERDYRHFFAEIESLEIMDWSTEFTEGDALITQELLEALPDYSREELTKRSIIVILRKRSR